MHDSPLSEGLKCWCKAMRKLTIQFADDALSGSDLRMELGRDFHCVLTSGASLPSL
jgi:hypothetical protein